jgi:acyl dehydratase
VTKAPGTGDRIIDSSYGRCLEEFRVGDRFLHWPGRTITDGDHQLFCLLTGSTNPIHTDRSVATSHSVFGQIVVVGTYIYSLLAGMTGPELSGSAIANLGLDHLEHIAPLHVGDSPYAETEIVDVRPSGRLDDRGIVTTATVGMNQSGVIVCRFTRGLLVWRRHALPPRPTIGARRISNAQ